MLFRSVAGTFLVVGLGEEDFASLTPEMARKYEQLFHQPEAFLKLGNRLLVLPVPDEPPAEKPRTKPPAEQDRKKHPTAREVMAVQEEIEQNSINPKPFSLWGVV